MAPPPGIYVVCSGQHRNGKTLLARVLVDYLLVEQHDPFAIDLSHPEGMLRSYFPGRTAMVDFEHVAGQMKAFDTILTGRGRDYVIDIPAHHLATFCETFASLQFREALRKAGFKLVVFCIIDQGEESLKDATRVEELLAPDLFIPVRNEFVGSALPHGFGGITLAMPVLDPEVVDTVSSRRFSFRTFLLGDEQTVPLRLRPNLKGFLHSLLTCFRDIGPALSLLNLRG